MIATTRARRRNEPAARASVSLLSATTADPSALVSPPLITTLFESDETFAFGERSVWLVAERHAESVSIRAILSDRKGARRIVDKHNVGRECGDDGFWYAEEHPLNIEKLVL